MASLSRFAPQSQSRSNNYLIYAPFCSPNVSISTFIECYDPSNNSWRYITSIPTVAKNLTLKDFAMISVGDHIYVIGGRLCKESPRHGIEDYDNNNNFVEELEEPSILSSVHKYNIRTDSWTTCSPMVTPRFDFACTVSNNKIYAAGGQSSLSEAKGISLFEVYDPCLDEWKSLANMSTMRYKCVGVKWNGKIHVMGGFVHGINEIDQGPFVMTRSSAEVYDDERDEWDFKDKMWQLDVPPYQIVELNGKLFGSGDCFRPWKGHIEFYDEKENLWTVVPGSQCDRFSLSKQRMYLTMTPIGKKMYFLAGYRMSGDPSRFMSEVRVFDTEAEGVWKRFEPIEEGQKELCGHCCVLIKLGL